MNDRTLPEKWRTACSTSRFFEQAAMEALPEGLAPEEFYVFPTQVN